VTPSKTIGRFFAFPSRVIDLNSSYARFGIVPLKVGKSVFFNFIFFMTYSIVPLFSQVFYCNHLTDISMEELEKVKQFLIRQEYKKHYPGDPSIFGDSTVRFDLLDQDELKFLKERLLREITFFKNTVLRVENLNFGITTSWAIRSKPGNESIPHYHSNCYYSGIFYVNVVPNSGDIAFKDLSPRSFTFDEKISEWNIYNSVSHTWTPENRTLILFPSGVHHQFLQNESDIDRYSIAFNIIPLGQVGNDDSRFTYRREDGSFT